MTHRDLALIVLAGAIAALVIVAVVVLVLAGVDKDVLGIGLAALAGPSVVAANALGRISSPPSAPQEAGS